MTTKDYVGDYISLKENAKKLDEQIGALEVLILANHRDDERIRISRKSTIVINEEAYRSLESVGISTKITETRPKKIGEFDKEIQELILKNPDNYEETFSKEWIRIK